MINLQQERQGNAPVTQYRDRAIPLLQVQLVHPRASLPVRVHTGDAGYDLACCETTVVPARHEVLVPIGIRLQIPDGFYVRIVGRSSSYHRGLDVAESIIDTGYHGLIFVRTRGCRGTITVLEGERLAQLILVPLVEARVELSAEISTKSPDGRDSNGFGSTGGWK